MDLLQLEHFLAVVEERSFRRAAERVYRTQPAVSRSVKKLEEEIGSPLFCRDMPDLSLTATGKALVDYARQMMRLRENALRRLGQLATLGGGSLSIAACESTATYLLPGVLQQFAQRFPQIRLRIEQVKDEEIPHRVIDRQVDMGFVKVKPSFHQLQSELVYADNMLLVGTPSHPLARQRRLKISDLANERFVLHHALCQNTQQSIFGLFKANSTKLNVVAELATFESIKNFVVQGLGIAIVPRVTITRELSAGTLAGITVDRFHIPRYTLMVFRESGYLSDAAREFVGMVKHFDWQRSVSQPIRHARAASRQADGAG